MDKNKGTALAIGGIAVVGAGVAIYALTRGKKGTASLTGRVISGVDNSNISGAHVTLGDKSATTGIDGLFTIDDLTPGQYPITIKADDYQDYTGGITVDEGHNERTFQLFREVHQAGLSGRVTDQNTGEPLYQVNVQALNKTASTQTNGTYSITDLTSGPGTVTVTFTKQGYKTKTANIILKDGANVLDMVMNNLGTVQGRVFDSVTNVAIQGALVKSGAYETTTKAAGNYSLTMPSGQRVVTVTKTGYNSDQQTVTIEPEVVKPLDFPLVEIFEQTGVVKGTVKDSLSLNPIPNVNVVFNPGNHIAQANYLGQYSIELPSNSSPGITYSIAVSHSGYQTYNGSVTVRTGTYNNKDILLVPVQVPNGAVDGYVLRATDGAPIYNAAVDIQYPTQLRAYTNSQGYYKIQNVPPGNYQIGATASGYAQQMKTVQVVSGQTARVPDFRLQPEGGGIGFFMGIDFDYTYYPTASLWYADVAGMYHWFASVDPQQPGYLWDESDIDLTTRPWPSVLTVELYDSNFNLVKRNTKTVTLVNGHVYTFLVNNAGGQLIDNGLY